MLTTCCMFAGLATLPFADHIAIYMIGPILTMILAIIFLKESFKQTNISDYYRFNWSYSYCKSWF